MSYLDTEIVLYHSQQPAPSAKWDLCLGAAGAGKRLSVVHPASDFVLDTVAAAMRKPGAEPQ